MPRREVRATNERGSESFPWPATSSILLKSLPALHAARLNDLALQFSTLDDLL
jgi:hypothetical protein